MRAWSVALALVVAGCNACASPAERPLWEQLPEPAPLPRPAESGVLHVNGIDLYFARFGAGPPVVLLAGGLAAGDYWGGQVADFARSHSVILVDQRGWGRATRDRRPYSYSLMAEDTLALMDALGLQQAAIVGWSDGANVGLDIAVHHPERLVKLVVFGANYDTAGLKWFSLYSPTLRAYLPRARRDYARLSPTPGDFDALIAAVQKMWDDEPHFTSAQLGSIRVPTAVLTGEHEEAIKPAHTRKLAELIPGARLVVLRGVGHFGLLQDPAAFNAATLAFLDEDVGNPASDPR